MDIAGHTNPTIAAIYASYQARLDTYKPRRLGVSLLGGPCDRRLWYAFRHASVEHIDGRILRLFATGHLEEPRMIADLRAIGCTVLDQDPDTGRQYHAQACGGHLGASIDAAVLGLPEAPKTWHDVSFKTMNAKSFAKLQKNGLREAFPGYHAQLVVEMHMHEFDRGAVLAVCKDNDDLYFERFHPDPETALRLIARAQRVIDSKEPPPKIGSADWYECRMCPFHGICHGGAFADRSCRTCIHATPVPGPAWTCAVHGECRWPCTDHRFIPALVHGEQIDFVDGVVIYKLKDGKEWRDGGC